MLFSKLLALCGGKGEIELLLKEPKTTVYYDREKQYHYRDNNMKAYFSHSSPRGHLNVSTAKNYRAR